MLPVNSGGHSAYQNFVIENLRKYYPVPSSFPASTWDIIERFWTLGLTYTDELLRSKYSVFGPKPSASCQKEKSGKANAERLQSRICRKNFR